MSLKDIWNNICTEGLKLPFAHDPTTGKASITLLFPYIAFLLAIITNIALAIKDIQIGTFTAIVFWALAVVFYMIRSLHKAKFDLDDASFELESTEKDEDKEDVEKE